MSKLKNKGDKQVGSRRKFAKTLAVMAATPLVSRAGLAAPQEPTPARPRPPQAPPADAPGPAAEALTEAARQRYPFLKKDDLEQIKRSIDRTLRNGDRLKQIDLRNSDEPAFAFSADIPRAAAKGTQRRERERGREKQGRRENENARRKS
ncbi:MAG TPA: hypothetical protein VNI02_04215 [Blastocatellia bacterium]|nr:hypothetical protein [Blastocatellia bacterium]